MSSPALKGSLLLPLLFFFATVVLQLAPDLSDLDDEIGQRSDDSQHLRPVGDRLGDRQRGQREHGLLRHGHRRHSRRVRLHRQGRTE